MFALLMILTFFYFNGISTGPDLPTYEPSGCQFGEGNAGDGAGYAPYIVCPGEDFWLPSSTEESKYGKAGVWQSIVKRIIDPDTDEETLKREKLNKDSNYYRINWDLSNSLLYSTAFNGNGAEGLDNPSCINKSFTSIENRRNFYTYTQINCIEICEQAKAVGIVAEGYSCAVSYEDNQNDVYYSNLYDHYDLFINDQLPPRPEDSEIDDVVYPECRGQFISHNEELAGIFDNRDTPDGKIYYTLEGIKFCNPQFKTTDYFKKKSIKLMISLGEGKVMNGALPDSCNLRDTIRNFFNYGGVNWPEEGTAITEFAKKDPDWSKLGEIKTCVKEHYKNILSSIDKFGIRDQIYSINFTHEGGVLWDFYKLANLNTGSITERDNLQNNWIESVAQAVDEYVDTDTTVGPYFKSARKSEWKKKFYVNFYHGRAFKSTVETALSHDMGIGEHSLSTPYSYSYLQHLPHLTYNQANKRYDVDETKIPSILHTDVEGLHKQNELEGQAWENVNTWGSYRYYRNSLLREIAYRYNSITNTAELIPSKGLYYNLNGCDAKTEGKIVDQNDEHNFCNFNYAQIDGDQIDGDGAFALYEWSRKMISRPKNDSPEAYCIFSQNGNEVPSLLGKTKPSGSSKILSFNDFIDINKAQWHWGQLRKDPKYSESKIQLSHSYTNATALLVMSGFFDHENGYQPYIYAPVVKSAGLHCKTVQLPSSITTHQTDLSGGRKLDAGLNGLTDPMFNNKVFSGLNDSNLEWNSVKPYAFEATRLEGVFSKLGAIILDFDNSFVSQTSSSGTLNKQWVLKLTFSVKDGFCNGTARNGAGSFWLRYRDTSNRLVRSEIKIDTDDYSVCEERKFATSSGNLEIKNVPKILTVTVPFHSETAGKFDPTKEVRTYGSKSLTTSINDNLVIEQEPRLTPEQQSQRGKEQLLFDFLMVRLIDKNYTEK
jgi:hypothetical protein